MKESGGGGFVWAEMAEEEPKSAGEIWKLP